MGWIGWIVLGGIAGWIASMITKNNAGMGVLANIICGIIGGVLGGFVFDLIGGEGVTGFNLWSLLVAVVGSVIVLAIYNAIRRKN